MAAWVEEQQATPRSHLNQAIDRLVLLGATLNGPAEKLKSSTLFIVARDDANEDGPRLPRIREQYEKAPQPKDLIILDGSGPACIACTMNSVDSSAWRALIAAGCKLFPHGSDIRSNIPSTIWR